VLADITNFEPKGDSLVSRGNGSTVFAGMLAMATMLVCPSTQAQTANEWVWTAGSSIGDQAGVYGTQGQPAIGNTPGARNGASQWKDSTGHLWLYGGAGYAANGSLGLLNDLWEFNPSTNQWTWISGDSALGVCLEGVSPQWTTQTYCGQPGVYGTVLLAGRTDTYHPGARYGASSWIDSSGNLWLFGGYGFDVNGGLGALNDLWKFIPTSNQWLWVSGNDSVAPVGYGTSKWLNESGNSYTYFGQPGAYGALGTSADANNPGGRFKGSSWLDSGGNLWLFGGFGFDAEDSAGELNDLWEFNPSTSQWAWMGGSKSLVDLTTSGFLGGRSVGGTLGTPASGNIPGGRHGASSWNDSSGKFWLYGGFGLDVNGNLGISNDLWEFNPSTSQWAWMGGDSAAGNDCSAITPNQPAIYCDIPPVYGALGTPATTNNPGSREEAVSWTDGSGNFWLFGGYNLLQGTLGQNGQVIFNDLWEFNPLASEWAWMGGTDVTPICSVCANSGVYGMLGTPDSSNMPGSREGASAWVDSNGYIWLFGGNGLGADKTNPYSSLNDLWKYESTTGSAPIVAGTAAQLSTTSLTFESQTVGSTSAPQRVMLTNPGNSALSIISIMASGTFGETNTCGNSIAAGANCTVSVTFTPTNGGSLTGAITITDNAPNSPQSVTLTGTGANVSITPPSTGITVGSAGGSATANIQLASVGGFTGTVNLTCSVVWQGTGTATDAPTCNLNPAQEQVASGASVTTTLTVNTTASNTARVDNPWLHGSEGMLTALLLFGLVPRKKWKQFGLTVVLSLITIGAITGCGSGAGGSSSSSGGSGSNSNPGTSTGSYVISVSAASGTAIASTEIPLSVQ
jgi:N-acetylneuraminic acid mutarotase